MSTHYIPAPIPPSLSRQNRDAFEQALQEVDYETYQRVTVTIHQVANVLIRERGLLPETAMGQALEFVAACVWNKAKARQ